MSKFPVRSAFFLVFTAFLTVIVQQKTYFSSMMKSRLTEAPFNPSLWVLVEGEEGKEGDLKKLISHPGIKKIVVRRDNQIKEGLITDLRQADFQVPQVFLDKKFWGFKVFFTGNADRKSELEIKGHIGNIFGRENVSFGPMRKKEDPQYQLMGKVYSIVREWGYPLAVFIIFSFWCFFYYLVSIPISEVGTLIERFQKRGLVRFRISFYGLLFVDLVMSFLCLKMGAPSLISVLALTTIFLVFSGLASKLKNAYE